MLAMMLIGCKEDKWMDWKMQNEVFMQQNIQDHQDDPNFHVTGSGLQYRIRSKGNTSDAKPDNESYVICDYTGTLVNGHPFDAAQGASFYLGNGVIEGFAEGVKQIYPGGYITIWIPQELAYKNKAQGTEGSHSSSYIPPYSALRFDIHLKSVSK